MKEYAFSSALWLNNNICVYFLKGFIRFSIAYENKRYLKYPGTAWTTSKFYHVKIVK